MNTILEFAENVLSMESARTNPCRSLPEDVECAPSASTNECDLTKDRTCSELTLSSSPGLEEPCQMPRPDVHTTIDIGPLLKRSQDSSCANFHEDLPPLLLSDSDDSLSASNGDDSFESLQECPSPTRKRRVVFHPSVTVREHSVTVGDHPMCDGSLALSLDWPHAKLYLKDIDSSRDRGLFYMAPRRLSFEDRHKRLETVAGYNPDELAELAVEDQEDDGDHSVIVQAVKSSWRSFTLVFRNSIEQPMNAYDSDVISFMN